MPTVLLFNLFNGLIIGVFYALMALGLGLILSLNRVINMSHGAFLALGGYLAFTLSSYIGFWGALIISPILAGVLGLVFERFFVRSLYQRKDPLYTLLLTFGAMLIIEDLLRTVWGPQVVSYAIPAVLSRPLSNYFFFLTGYRVFIILVVALAVTGLFLFLHYSRVGIRIRAAIFDLETVSSLGINVYLLRTINFGIGIALAGLAGVLAAGWLGLDPTMGDNLIMPSFVAIITGGVGSLVGGVLGGLVIGLASGLATVYFPAASTAVIYLVLAIVLIIRPRGLLGQEGMFE